MVNISPIGRNVSNNAERDEFQRYDQECGIRKKLVDAMKGQFSDSGLTFSIGGGKISVDTFPTWWDKTYCLRYLGAEKEKSGLVYLTRSISTGI
jgi:phosphomannomutase